MSATGTGWSIRFVNDLEQRLLFGIRQYVFRSTLFSGDKQKRSSERVFTSTKMNGRLIAVKKAFNTARLEGGIPDFQMTDLRHSCASRSSDRGEELVTVDEILGHAKLD